jgi:hypothetical protein
VGLHRIRLHLLGSNSWARAGDVCAVKLGCGTMLLFDYLPSFPTGGSPK